MKKLNLYVQIMHTNICELFIGSDSNVKLLLRDVDRDRDIDASFCGARKSFQVTAHVSCGWTSFSNAFVPAALPMALATSLPVVAPLHPDRS
jgi:hypothetical protein